ncbi:MAG: efflux RND transporter periplasmic adaptor subunit [Bacteroides sp.]|jgi:membrane fusion protein (multidrug efflux system)|nr:efflux RND transporter periplasmic adaptor subunit [Bacteroides sp.]MCI1683912.1 efflux RND transporter periplasmic adaptor subunit [Bacteroides sp.]
MKSRLILLTFCLLLFSCGQKDKGNNTPDCAVITVQATDANSEVSYPATIKGKQDVEIRPKVAGFITKLYIDEGDIVHKGQPLFLIDPVQYREAVNIAEADVKSNQATVATQQLTVNNKRQLLKKNIISEYDMQMAENQLASVKAALAQAQANLVKARQDLTYCTVTSPSNGIAGSIPFRVGSLVSSSTATPLTIVSDISEMYAYFSMTEKQLLDLIRDGGTMKDILAKMPKVKLQLIDGSIYKEKGKVATISGVIDSSTGSVSMRAAFPNPNNILRSGGTGNVIFPYTFNNIVVIPQAATVEIQDKKFVFVLQKDNTLKNTEIQIVNLDDGKSYLVTKGLKAGDKIAIEGVQNLKDGESVKPITPREKEAEYQKALKDQKDGNLSTAFN